MRGLPDSVGNLNPDDYEIWADDTKIRTKTDNTERILKGREMGIVAREPVAEAIGLNPSDILDLPSDVTDFEQWLITRGSQVAVTAVARDIVDEDGEPFRAPSGADVEEPDRDQSRQRLANQLEAGPPDPPDGEIEAAIIEVSGELRSRRPSYWDDLVPGQ
jgi:hypothetical protein